MQQHQYKARHWDFLKLQSEKNLTYFTYFSIQCVWG